MPVATTMASPRTRSDVDSTASGSANPYSSMRRTSERLRGQNDYDAWHISAVSGNGAGSVYRPDKAKTCQDCHMPLEPAVQGDSGAKNGMVRSHRFLGANTALPHLRGDAEQEQRTMENLRGRASLALLWSGPARVDALMRARGVGHRFPGGTMDSNEVWLEVTAFNAAGKVPGKDFVCTPAPGSAKAFTFNIDSFAMFKVNVTPPGRSSKVPLPVVLASPTGAIVTERSNPRTTGPGACAPLFFTLTPVRQGGRRHSHATAT